MTYTFDTLKHAVVLKSVLADNSVKASVKGFDLMYNSISIKDCHDLTHWSIS